MDEETGLQSLLMQRNGDIPNNPDLPVVLMKGAVAGTIGAAAIRALLERNGWGGTWEYTVFDFHHYHPNAHEALVVARGWADLILGRPGAETLRVEAGDAVVLPAGTGHCRADAAPDFLVCGAYPPGQERYDTLRAGDPWPDDLTDRIARVPSPRRTPSTGGTARWCRPGRGAEPGGHSPRGKRCRSSTTLRSMWFLMYRSDARCSGW